MAAVMMFIPTKESPETNEIRCNEVLAFFVPIMLVILKIPLRTTIASSLAISFIASIGGSIGKITTGQVEWLPTRMMILASLIVAPLGAKNA